ncbi:MAG TPA: hypothetical protein VL418_15005 [Devosiaceae bacterium]|nr:hypothetical protein [Devosiaceae bacterium]
MAAALVFFSSLAAAAMPAVAAPPPSNAALLQSYVGSYVGQGTVFDGRTTRALRCRINFRPTGAVRVGYAGRCSAGGGSFSLAGVIAYDQSRRAFVAAMSSSAARATVTLVGRRSGGRLVFRSRQAISFQGRIQDVSSTMALTGGAIRIDFRATDPRTGRTTAGSIPLSRVAS